jgi:ribonuclease HII
LLLPFFHNKFIETGVDEAGRGCYAGPVYAAAVILPKDFYHPLLNDSKKLTAGERDLLRPIVEKECISFSVASVSSETIDRINILQASIKAMHLAIKKLTILPELLLVDGNYFNKYKNIPHQCIIKGDGIYAAIAAASILAKTYRDEYMESLHEKFPMYYWNKNKGYGTRKHRDAIDAYGLSRYHRQTFKIWPEI